MSLTATSAPAPAAETPDAASATGVACFCGADRDYWRLLLRGAGLLMVTLGLYRFWLATDMRRFLWSNTELGGEPLEYTGTAIELLLGFLIAIGILVPIYIALFLALLYQGALGGVAGLLGFALVAVLGPYAVYRARRYRLTRTVFRGVRFHQEGSAWRYALCALLWWSSAILTLGLTYPWVLAHLERFKMRHTFYGDLPGRFEGSGLRLFGRGILMWVVVAGPLLVGLVYAVRAVDWKALAQATEQGRGVAASLDGTGLAEAGAAVLLVLGWSVCAATMLYPAFQALTWRWWTSGLRFGELTLHSHLRTAQVYRIYLRFLGYGVAFVLVAGMSGFFCLAIAGFLLGGDASTAREAAATGLLLVGYVVMALGFSTIYQVKVKLAFWRAVIDALAVSRLDVLERVKAAGTPSSPVGEGLADVLNVGGI